MLQVVSEEPVYSAVLSWVKHDASVRDQFLAQLLQYVRLPLMSAKFITDTVDDEVRTNPIISGFYT